MVHSHFPLKRFPYNTPFPLYFPHIHFSLYIHTINNVRIFFIKKEISKNRKKMFKKYFKKKF